MRAWIMAMMLAAASCADSSGSFPANTSAIVDQELIEQAACGRLPRYGDGAWTPPQSMIAPLETALFAHLVPELERDAEVFNVTALDPGDYYRRYAGVTFQGRRVIVICGEARQWYDERGIDWRTKTIPYRDGGSRSFGAHYDPEADEITYFEFGYVG